jgi:hypothetical protein
VRLPRILSISREIVIPSILLCSVDGGGAVCRFDVFLSKDEPADCLLMDAIRWISSFSIVEDH